MVTSQIPVGSFSFSSTDEQWSWSDGMFALHGMHRGDVVPNRAIFLSHVHPDDRSGVAALLDSCATGDGRPAALDYRMVALDGAVHEVLLALRPVGGEGSTAVWGFLVDEGERRKRVVAAGVDAELRHALESHAVIDQAKGMLMLAYGGDEEDAFNRLRQASQHNNIKLRTLADRIVTAGRTAGSVDLLRAEVDDLLLVAERSPQPAALRR